ncbi:MAG: hypothetical protein RLZZ562_3487 [Planctomycetota bacterium]|jgi:hypothetical protein
MTPLANLLNGFLPRLDSERGSHSKHSPLAAVALACLAFGALAPDAVAQDTPQPHGPVGLKRVGPVDDYVGYPYWYEDTTGLKLGICKDPGRCFFGASPLAPVSFPQSVADAQAGNYNWPDEMFYYAAENLEIAPLPLRARVLWHVAIEGAFASGSVMPGQQVTWSRLRIRLRGLAPESAYTIRHPYGEEVIETDVEGGAFYTRDLGLVLGDFTGAIYGDVGPFLVPTGFNRNSPKGTYLSDGGLTLETVEGSPLGRNYVEYEGPGIGQFFPALAVDGNPNKIRSSVFSMQGQVAEQHGVGIDDAYYSASGNSTDSTLATTVSVFAQSAEGQNMIARAQSGAWVPMQESSTPGHYFAQIDLGGANSALPSNLEVRNASDTPVTSKGKATLPDLVTVHGASYTIGQGGGPSTLAVEVTSTDTSRSRTVDIEFGDFQVIPGTTGGQGDAAINQPVPATYVPPTAVTVRSSAGGVTEFPLAILGTGKSTQTPQTPGPSANAGLDQSVDIRTVITLNANASTGNIVNYMWAPPVAGFEIDSVASQGAQLVGLVTQAGDLTFTLTVLDDAGRASTDTVVVHVNDPNVIQDAITITAARFDVGRQLWDVVGSSTVEWNQRVDLYFALLDETGIMVRDANGNPVKDPNRRIGAAIVGALGVWRYRLPVSILEPENVPTGLDTTIIAESALGGRATIVFRASR